MRWNWYGWEGDRVCVYVVIICELPRWKEVGNRSVRERERLIIGTDVRVGVVLYVQVGGGEGGRGARG